MAFNRDLIAQRLKGFKIENIRVDERFEMGTKRFTAREIMVPIKGRLLMSCTDERAVKEIIDPKTGEKKSPRLYTMVRAAGAAFGLVDAIRNVKMTINREEILKALVESEIVIANHTDTHAKQGELTGCGQGALRELPQSGSVFDRPAVPLQQRMSSYEEMGTLRVVLEGEHTAQGLMVNPYSDRVLNPYAGEAQHLFFSLDLGVYWGVLSLIRGKLGFSEGAMRTMLVKLTRNNLAAVFILSNADVNQASYIELNDDQDSFFAGVLHEGLGELKERVGSVLHVLEERMGEKQESS